MVNDLLGFIARSNIALAVCVALVLVLRAPVRRLAGARIAYTLWLIPPLAGAACLAPGRVEVITLPAISPLDLGVGAATHAAGAALDPRYILAAWIGGVAISLIVLILRQARFALALGRLRVREDLGEGVLGAESNEHGPAVLGVLRPVIITPADFDARFSDEERRIVLEHERAHVAQGDPLINALAAALQCMNWFNPLVHLGVRALRLDQELACDAAVLATGARRSYAEALLKTQIAAGAPLGCAWPSHSLAALKERIAMLKHNLPTRTQRILGVSAVGLLSFTACAVAWASQPPRIVVAPNQATARVQPEATPLPPDPLAAPAAYVAPASSAAVTASAEAALAGADPDAVADGDDQGDIDNDLDINIDLADLDDPDHVATIVDDNGHVTHRRLTAEERERIRNSVRQAMQAQRTAMEQSRAAMAQARVAMREAQRQVERAHLAEVTTLSPQMRAELAAITAQATRLAGSAHMNGAEREAMRQAIEARSAHLRAMARQMAAEARDEARAQIDRERAHADDDANDAGDSDADHDDDAQDDGDN